MLGQLGENALRIRVVFVDLVDRDDDRHLSGARVVDRLDRLRHHAVVSGDHQHDDVGHLCAAGAHLCERGVAGRVDERDLVTAALHLVGADVLGDATGLTRDNVRRADLVENGRLAMVDVTHDGYHRGSRSELLLIVVIAVVEEGLQLEFLLLTGVDEQKVRADIEGEQLHVIVGEGLRSRDHLAVVQQELDHVRSRPAELRGELLSGHAALDDDRSLGNRGAPIGERQVLRLELVLVAATTPTATTRRTALSAGAPGTAAGTTPRRTTGTAPGTGPAEATGAGAAGGSRAARSRGVAARTRARWARTRRLGLSGRRRNRLPGG